MPPPEMIAGLTLALQASIHFSNQRHLPGLAAPLQDQQQENLNAMAGLLQTADTLIAGVCMPHLQQAGLQRYVVDCLL